MTKSEIRSFVKGLVRGISVEERTRFSEALKEEVVGLECWRSAKEVMLFFSLPDATCPAARAQKCRFCARKARK